MIKSATRILLRRSALEQIFSFLPKIFEFCPSAKQIDATYAFLFLCVCFSAYLSSCYRTASDANLLDDPHTFHCIDCFVIGRICTCLEVSNNPMLQLISLNSCPLNLLLLRSHQAEIIIVKRLTQGRNSVTRVRVEPRLFDHGRCRNDAFTLSATLLN